MSNFHQRVRNLNRIESGASLGPVVYWMFRDQRVTDNWALLFAQQCALERKVPLRVVVCLRKDLNKHFGTRRMLDFMLKGLAEVETKLHKKQIQFDLIFGKPVESIKEYLNQHQASTLITDFKPHRSLRKWKQSLQKKLTIPFYEVDAHNSIPCWAASDKLEFAAHTLRPKIHRLLPDYLEEFPRLKKHPYGFNQQTPIDWATVTTEIKVDESVPPTDFVPGEKAADNVLQDFLSHRLSGYATRRNDPNQDALSNLSPYLHFGHISAQRVALEVDQTKAHSDDKEAFLEELIVRRELADNYCFYQPDYDKFSGFHEWAQRTLNAHRGDTREYVYSLEEFEQAQTHEAAWNAAQLEMVKTGKMHGYMRMYWAKKILEWTESPEQAQEFAIYLNDKYSIDGRDPNGYVGIAWSIGGVHDRAWAERPVYGKIRYMALSGLQRKFDVDAYIKKVHAT